jgi:hypothetical protein
MSAHEHTNGVAQNPAELASPSEIVDLAAACVRYVERATGVALDYTPETLPILDHYLKGADAGSGERAEARELVVLAAGAYFGEIVRKRYASWWRIEGGLESARVELREMFLAFSPMDMVRQALDAHAATASSAGDDATESPGDDASFDLDDADRAAVHARLAELPEVPADEYYAPSTRLEVLDIAADAIRARRLAESEPELDLEPGDYDD